MVEKIKNHTQTVSKEISYLLQYKKIFGNVTECIVYTYIKQGATPLHTYLVGYYRVGAAQMNSESNTPTKRAMTVYINASTGYIHIRIKIQVAAQSKAWVCSRSPAGIAVSNPTGVLNVCLL